MWIKTNIWRRQMGGICEEHQLDSWTFFSKFKLEQFHNPIYKTFKGVQDLSVCNRLRCFSRGQNFNKYYWRKLKTFQSRLQVCYIQHRFLRYYFIYCQFLSSTCLRSDISTQKQHLSNDMLSIRNQSNFQTCHVQEIENYPIHECCFEII